MQKVDSHTHFWKYDAVRDGWITENMAVIKRDFFPGDAEALFLANGIEGCVAVQASATEEENDFLLKLAERHSFIKGVVGWVDLLAADVHARMQHFSRYKKFKGVRYELQAQQPRNFMLDPLFMKGISALNTYNLTYDILILEDQLQYIPPFVSAFPNQVFVLDHLGKPNIKGGSFEIWKKQLLDISRFENVYCKLSGMVTEADWQHWRKEELIPYMDAAVEAFGTDRIMFGGDWPVCLLAASYTNVVDIVETYFSNFSQHEQEKVFALNAAKFYKL